MYWIELRRSPLRWCFPLLIALDVATLFGRSRWWVGEWAQTSAQVQIPCFYMAPLLAAAAAWTAGRASRNNLDAQLDAAARPVWQIELTQLSATLTYGLTVYGVGAVVAAVTSYPEAGPGFLWPGYLALGATLLVSFTSAGHLVGRWSRSHFFAPVLCGIGGLVIIAWFGAPAALGLYVISGSPFQEVSSPVLLVHCLVAAVLMATAVLLRRRSPGMGGREWAGARRHVRTASLSVLTGAAVLGLLTAGPVQVARSAPRQPLCTTGVHQVCLWPEDRKYLPQTEGMADRMSRIPPGLFKIPPVFYERGLRGPRFAYDDFYILDGSMWDASVTMAGNIMTASYPKGCPLPIDSRITPQFKLASGELNVWLAMRIFGAGVPADMHGGPPDVNLHAVAHVTTQPEDVQVEWAKQRLGTIHHAFCG
ncbi:hypothetical protein ACWGQL_34885 [Streptomyces lydicus]